MPSTLGLGSDPLTATSNSPRPHPGQRPHARGPFLWASDEKLFVRGVTYGTFQPNAAGEEFHDRQQVERDFALMAAHGINTVRTYTPPPRWLLDVASANGLWVMVGLPWTQHVTFLDSRRPVQAIVEAVRRGARACAGHPAVLCYSIGNEIPAGIVRWYGPRRIERFLKRLYTIVKAEDPAGLVTYVNYPTTEYLRLPFLDLVAFNVYLEQPEAFERYLARLQHVVGERPLLLAELGLDSRRNGVEAQADALNWQIRSAFAAGCAGTIVFAWTDEWYRGGQPIEDWDFGLTDRRRRPKPALFAVAEAFAEVPFPADMAWPFISVVICSHNGARTLNDSLRALARLHYPCYEVIVVDDGSSDATATIASSYNVRLISVPQGGLSQARNLGLFAAHGEIVAYLDDDAYPDPDWLRYLASAFLRSRHVGIGGPNLAPPDDGPVAACVANAPGGPVHIMLSDTEAEHIPGCNMAFRREQLLAIGGFDRRFRTAGDDVDICWRLQYQGWTLGFSPGALVWHHRRDSIRAYWRQQCGYGKAEALLEQKWPAKYNPAGHAIWAGRIYGAGQVRTISLHERIFYGVWGSALFQSIYQRTPGPVGSLPLMPEWYLIILATLGLGVLGTVLWPPLTVLLVVAALALTLTLGQALRSAQQATFAEPPPSRRAALWRYGLTVLLYLIQPAARLHGRLRNGLSLWRWHGLRHLGRPWRRHEALWSEQWQAPEAWLEAVEQDLLARGDRVRRGSEYDRWDLDVPGGVFGTGRLLLAIEEHGGGKQLLRWSVWARWARVTWLLLVPLSSFTIAAALDEAWLAAAKLGALTLLVALRASYECAVGATILRAAVGRLKATHTVPAPR
ncbi:MAG: hypothetical protein OHK0015_52760 [Chloroflexi bacterium OHK40]